MYKQTSTTLVVRITDGANIPPDPANRDYAEYLAWVAAGNVAQAADPVSIPEPQATLADLLDVLPQESKDAVAATLATRAAGGAKLDAAQPAIKAP